MTPTQIDINRFTYRVTWSVEDAEFVATCLELPSISWLAGTQEEALHGLRDAIAEVIEDLNATGEAVPAPPVLAELLRQVQPARRRAAASQAPRRTLSCG